MGKDVPKPSRGQKSEVCQLTTSLSGLFCFVLFSFPREAGPRPWGQPRRAQGFCTLRKAPGKMLQHFKRLAFFFFPVICCLFICFSVFFFFPGVVRCCMVLMSHFSTTDCSGLPAAPEARSGGGGTKEES